MNRASLNKFDFQMKKGNKNDKLKDTNLPKHHEKQHITLDSNHATEAADNEPATARIGQVLEEEKR